MNLSNRYQNNIYKSVNDTFQKLFNKETEQNSLKTKISESDLKLAISIVGAIKGKFILSFPQKTLTNISKHFFSNQNISLTEQDYVDVAGEISNLITGHFISNIDVNNQYIDITHPEVTNNHIINDHSYNNLPLSYSSDFGRLNINFYYQDLA